MCWLPSWLVDASTTEGDEYALDVTHVQWKTKKAKRAKAFITTTNRASMPKMAFCLGASPFLVGVAAATKSFKALLAEALVASEGVTADVAAAMTFLDFFEEGVEATGAVAVPMAPVVLASLSLRVSSMTSGSRGSIYVSRR